MSSIDSWASLVGDGWKNLILETHEKLVHLDPDYTILQIKEKFGTLRYYFLFSNGLDQITVRIMNDVVALAEDRSGFICEQCGRRAKLRCKNLWYFTACFECVPFNPEFDKED